MSKPREVPMGLEAYQLLGWLHMSLQLNGQITVDDWNEAVEKTTNEKPSAVTAAEGKETQTNR